MVSRARIKDIRKSRRKWSLLAKGRETIEQKDVDQHFRMG